jgi:putative ABC transport system ATP-binding protein
VSIDLIQLTYRLIRRHQFLRSDSAVTDRQTRQRRPDPWTTSDALPLIAQSTGTAEFHLSTTILTRKVEKMLRRKDRATTQPTSLTPNGHHANGPGCIIRAENVVKTYHTGTDEVAALNGIDFAVSRGEMVAVMGPSGCGKTTLLNCLSGLDDIDSGRIILDDTDLAALPDRQRTDYRARRMGFIFQVYNLLPVLSAVENVELPLLVADVRPKTARERAIEALETVGLEKWVDHRPAQLSGGQRQRVTVARALVTNPALVWADEPTGALDSRTANDIMDLMRDLNQRNGLTFVIVTHDAGIGDRCDRIVRMQDGQIAGEVAHDVFAECLAVTTRA